MKYTNIYILAIKELLGRKNYLIGLLILAPIIFLLLIYIPVRTIPGNDFAFQLSLLTVGDRILLVILSLLTALSIVMNIFVLRNKSNTQNSLSMAGQSGTGILSGVIGSVFLTVTIGILEIQTLQ